MKEGQIISTLDIGTTKITVSICRMSETMQTEVVGLATKPFESQRHGMMTNIDAASETIRTAVEHAELMSGEVVENLIVNVSGLPTRGQHSKGIVAIASSDASRAYKESRQVQMKDILRAIEMAESVSIPNDYAILHSIPARFTVDSLNVEEPLGASGVRLEVDVYLLLCQKVALENIEKAVSLANYGVQDITLQGLASAEAVLTSDEKKAGALVIDIGGSQTDIVFFTADSVAFTHSFEIGSSHISRDLAYGLRTSLQTAEEVKLKHGMASADSISENDFITVPMLSYKKTSRIARKAIVQIIEARVQELFTLAKKAIDEARITSLLESGIVLTGGGSMLPGMVESGEEIFSIPVRLGEALEISAIDKNAFNPQNATVIGLAKMALSQIENEMHTPAHRATSQTQRERNRGEKKSFFQYIKNFFN